MKILIAGSEVAPFVKVGGLGDVLGSLPQALVQKRASVRVVLPLYGTITDEWRSQMKFLKYIYVQLSWRNLYCGIFELKRDGVTYYFLDNEYYFKRGETYGHFDDGERFAFFSKAIVSFITELGDWVPDVVHCNDWQTALVPVYLRHTFGGMAPYSNIKTVFSIHNIEYQGRYDRFLLGDIFGLSDDLYSDGTMEFMGGISLMKGAILCSDAVSTVSPTYAEELHYSFFAHGLEGVISANSSKLSGILNGIDMNVFNPETDPNLCQNYSVKDLTGKTQNKLELQRLLRLNEDPDIPMIAMVTRLVSHKGLDLVAAELEAIMDMDVQFVVLGRGDWHFEQLFSNAQHQYPGRFSANILYNNALAMKIYAGSDIFLMPSQAEPCGLGQLIAMRYGSVPIVRETGGLRDTVSPYVAESGEGNGFSFANYNAHDMSFVVRQAYEAYQNKKTWKALMEHGMSADFGWGSSAAKYMALYKKICDDKK